MTDQDTEKAAFHGHEGVQERLTILREYYELSWPIIAALDEFQGIPPSTLQRIKQTGVVPKKHRNKFIGVRAVDQRNRITINLGDINSAATTIVKHVKPKSKAEALVLLINHKLREKYHESLIS